MPEIKFVFIDQSPNLPIWLKIVATKILFSIPLEAKESTFSTKFAMFNTAECGEREFDIAAAYSIQRSVPSATLKSQEARTKPLIY